MNTEVVLMELPDEPATSNAFAAFYSLSPAGRVAAAARLVRLLRRERRRVGRRFLRSLGADVRFGCDGGETPDVECHLLTLTGWIVWLERRYGLKALSAAPPVVAHLRRAEREGIRPDRRSRTERQRRSRF